MRAAFLVFPPLFLENLPVVDRPKVFFNLPEMQNHRNRRNPKPIQLDVFESFVLGLRPVKKSSMVEICCQAADEGNRAAALRAQTQVCRSVIVGFAQLRRWVS